MVPPASLKVPGGQAAGPEPAQYWPGPAVQAVAPVVVLQEEAPVPLVPRPRGQGVQVGEPVESANVPVGQAVQDGDPGPE